MAQAGETLENPITRGRLTVLETADDTSAELLQVELVFAPRDFVPAIRRHPRQ